MSGRCIEDQDCDPCGLCEGEVCVADPTRPGCGPGGTCGNGTLEPPERCDTQIPAGQPGACPGACDDGNPCTEDLLLDKGTCGAVCSSSPIDQCSSGDGCCPSGCDAKTDGDCSATCGNGTLEPPEKCDTQIPTGQPGTCPVSCDDGNTCTDDTLLNGGSCGAICANTQVTQCQGGDGCCPSGCNAKSDGDCSASCGNGVLEPPEKCDTQIPAGQPGSCPVSCDDGNPCTKDRMLNGGSCDALCSNNQITQCQSGDGCCPTGCNTKSDGDCSASCGNGVLEPQEKCDTQIPAGQPGACPTFVSCDDGNPCTEDKLLNAGTCGAICSNGQVTQCQGGDGCCPSGCNAKSDGDCSASCGNGVLEPPEKCDTQIPAGQPGACPVSCDDGNPCTKDKLLNGGTCDAACSGTQITQCAGGDSCCPTGCNTTTDGDCSASCGNGVLETPEKCDTQIPAGQPGACPTACDDKDPCTKDSLLNGGTCDATCSSTQVNQCTGGDGCCPANCSPLVDSDCTPACLNQSCTSGGIGGGTACCSGAPHCTGSSPTARICRSTCGQAGEACTYNGDCCTGLSCVVGVCTAVTGDCIGDSCEAGDDCCSASSHCVGFFGATLSSCQAQCGNSGDQCFYDPDCCSGTVCLAGVCGSTAGYHWRTVLYSGGANNGVSKFYAPGSAKRIQVHLKDASASWMSYYLYDPRGKKLHSPFPYTQKAHGWSVVVPGNGIIVMYGNASGLSAGGSGVDAMRYLIADSLDTEPLCSQGKMTLTKPVRTGYTEDLWNDHAGTCIGSSTNEAVYTFTAPADGAYTFKPTHLQYGGIYLRKTCNGPELGCTAGTKKSLYATLNKGESVLLFVESNSDYSDPKGYYWVEVQSCTPMVCSDVNADCGTGSDNCGKTLDCGTCTGGLVCSSTTGFGQCCKPAGASCFSNSECCGTCSNGSCVSS